MSAAPVKAIPVYVCRLHVSALSVFSGFSPPCMVYVYVPCFTSLIYVHTNIAHAYTNLYNKGKTRNLEDDGIILAEFGSTRRFVDLLRWTH